MELNTHSQSVFSLRKVFSRILSKWYWLLLSVLVSGTIAYLVNRHTIPRYEVAASVYVKQAKDQVNSVEEVLLKRERESALNLYNETYFIKSRALIRSTLQDLDFGVSYFQETDSITRELYLNSPIELAVDTTSKFIPYGAPIKCTVVSARTYKLSSEQEWLQNQLGRSSYEFGKTYNENGFKFTMSLKKPVNRSNQEVLLQVNSLDALVSEYQGKLKVSTEDNKSSILIVRTEGTTPRKEMDFLNKHLEYFVKNDLREKNQATAKTSQFIDQLLEKSSDSLDQIQRSFAIVKGSSQTFDPANKSVRIQDELQNLQREYENLRSTIDFCDYLASQIRKNQEINAIPTGAGVENSILNRSVEELMKLQTESRALDYTKLKNNPVVQENERRMLQLKNQILANLNDLKATTTIKLNRLGGQIRENQRLQTQVIPEADREFADIQRKFNVTGEMVNFLMQQKALAGIARAATASDYKLVDAARVSAVIFDPMKNYITAIMIGLLIPIAIIVLKDSFNNKVVTKGDLLNNTSLPLLGIIGYDGPSKKGAISYSYKTSLTAESFRSVRTNLGYFIDGEEGAKTIMFISSISREGKTYCSKYLSFIMAISGKRTLLINADMRKPDGNGDLETEGFAGLSHYLSGKATMDEVILRTKVDNLYYIRSGEVPPNPAELLLGQRLKHILETARDNFDYIIIDTPPVSAFSDSTVLMKHADLAVCVVRQNYTTKPLLSNLNDLYVNNPNVKMALLFNHVDMQKLDSGYKASYYNVEYYHTNGKPTWWKQLLPS